VRHANGDAHIHADCDCDCDCHIHADGNCYAYTDSNGDSDIYCNGYGNCDSDGYGDSNCDHIAAAFTDATASSDAAAPTVRPAGCFISLGTRERTSRVPAMAAEHLFHARHGSQKRLAIPW